MLTIIYFMVYYLGLPLILLYFYLRFRSQREFISFFENLDNRECKENKEKREQAENKRYWLKIIFVVILIVFLSSWHLVTSELADIRMRTEIEFGFGGVYTENPVVVSLGPTYDVSKVIEIMKSKKERWLPGKVKEVVDLESLTNFKGIIAVYRTYDQRYIITYTYLSPYPLIKSFGFKYVKTDDDQLKIIKKDKRTIFYPLSPGIVDKTAKLLS
ncbi:hypothetical protein KGY77_11080 [Candidatus Bipolaricaulota bacterium]|nr:hypothetical protein [Candidatus Bipolaricaulota bacterium]MBS3793170.1 hypothetical protein [Candidatus Bipolaricaulota bacterium]